MNVQDDTWQDDSEIGYLASEPTTPEAWELDDFSDLVPVTAD